MYRKIFIPSEVNSNIPFVIPNEWYGREVEVVFSPAGLARETNKESGEDRLVELHSTWITEKSADNIFLNSVNEQVLAKDWLNKTEEEAWKNL